MTFCAEPLIADYHFFTFLVCCAGIAIYNGVEVIFLAFSMFSKYTDLYILSLLACAVGTMTNATGHILLFYIVEDNKLAALTVEMIGWFAMVTGFSSMMYSRLSLVKASDRVLKFCLGVVIFNAMVTQTTSVLFSFKAHSDCNSTSWLDGHATMEKFQVTAIFGQELLLSLGFLYYLHSEVFMSSKKLATLVRRAVGINGLVIALDVVVLFVAFAGFSSYQVVLKAVAYSMKLKMQFYVLNILSAHKSDFDKQISRNAGRKGSNGPMSNVLSGGTSISKATSQTLSR